MSFKPRVETTFLTRSDRHRNVVYQVDCLYRSVVLTIWFLQCRSERTSAPSCVLQLVCVCTDFMVVLSERATRDAAMSNGDGRLSIWLIERRVILLVWGGYSDGATEYEWTVCGGGVHAMRDPQSAEEIDLRGVVCGVPHRVCHLLVLHQFRGSVAEWFLLYSTWAHGMIVSFNSIPI